MDSLTIAGIVMALAAIGGGQYLEGGELAALLNGPAFLIVMGGTFGAVLLQTPYNTFKRALSLFSCIFKSPQLNESDTIEKIIMWNNVARKRGLMALDSYLDVEEDSFCRKGIEMLLLGRHHEAFRRVMDVDIETMEQESMQAIRVYESMGIYSPTIGIIGAVLGLIQVMKNLTDPNELGAGIAVAFVATIYGVALANLFFLPIASKLRAQVERKVRYREMILEGFLAISDGENSNIMRARLRGFIASLSEEDDARSLSETLVRDQHG